MFLANGDSWSHMKIMAARAVSLVVAMGAGWYIGREWGAPGDGLLYGVIVAPLLVYPYIAAMYQRHNAWLPEVDILAFIPGVLLLAAQAWGLL